MIKQKVLTLLVLLAAVVTGARAAWTGGTYTATANENLNAITVSDDATLTINADVTVTVTRQDAHHHRRRHARCQRRHWSDWQCRWHCHRGQRDY